MLLTYLAFLSKIQDPQNPFRGHSWENRPGRYYFGHKAAHRGAAPSSHCQWQVASSQYFVSLLGPWSLNLNCTHPTRKQGVRTGKFRYTMLGGGGSDRVLIKNFPGLVMRVRARSLTKMYPRHAFVRLILQVFAEFMSEWHMV